MVHNSIVDTPEVVHSQPNTTAATSPVGSSEDEALIWEDVRLLGNILGETLITQQGQELFDLVERVRAVAKSSRSDTTYDGESLSLMLRDLTADQVCHLARAFSHFLSLANIAEQHHQTRANRSSKGEGFSRAFAALIERGVVKATVT